MKGRGFGAIIAIAVVLTGCGVHRPTAQDTTGAQDPERAAALRAARQVQASVRGDFLVATYRPDAGLHAPSNSGHRCPAHTVQVRLLWNGADFTHGASTGGGAQDRHQALVVTADATSGEPCLIGADYGAATSDPRPGEIYLYGPRKDLVPTQ